MRMPKLPARLRPRFPQAIASRLPRRRPKADLLEAVPRGDRFTFQDLVVEASHGIGARPATSSTRTRAGFPRWTHPGL